mgnify:CR=1 FL=1
MKISEMIKNLQDFMEAYFYSSNEKVENVKFKLGLLEFLYKN